MNHVEVRIRGGLSSSKKRGLEVGKLNFLDESDVLYTFCLR